MVCRCVRFCVVVSVDGLVGVLWVCRLLLLV